MLVPSLSHDNNIRKKHISSGECLFYNSVVCFVVLSMETLKFDMRVRMCVCSRKATICDGFV